MQWLAGFGTYLLSVTVTDGSRAKTTWTHVVANEELSPGEPETRHAADPYAGELRDPASPQDLLTFDSRFPGHAKVFVHSRVAAERHGRRHVQHDRGALI